MCDSTPILEQPPLRKLWSLRLLRRGDGMLQRDMYPREFGSAQLRRLRKRLRRRNDLPERHVSAEHLCPQLPDQLVWWRRLWR